MYSQKKQVVHRNWTPSDYIYAINSARYHDKVRIFRNIPQNEKVAVLVELSDYSLSALLRQLKDSEVVDVLKLAESDDAVEILEHIPGGRRKRILASLPSERKQSITRLLKYSPETAGGLMQSEMIVVNKFDTVRRAISRIKDPRIKIRFNNVYVVDKKGHLVGIVSLRKLLLSNPMRRIKDIMLRNVISVHPNMDQEKVANVFRQHGLYSLPVVDNNGYLLGRITYDDVIDIVEQEIQEDVYKSVGLEGDEDVFDPVRKSLRGRAEWLIINLFTAFLAAAVVSLFKDTLQRVITLAVFMPVVAGMGGNAGTQTLTIVVRGIAIGRLKFKDYFRVIVKEVALGIINGAITGLIGGVIAIMMGANYLIGVVIFLAMIVNLINAGIMGTLIPLILKKIGQDPALGSGIILTTFTDVIGFLSYLGIAALMISFFHLY